MVFVNTETGWADWRWRFRNHVAAASPGARAAMKFAEVDGAAPVSEEEVTASGWGLLSDKRYSSSAGFTLGECSAIVRNTPGGSGPEALKNLKQRWCASRAQVRVGDKKVRLRQGGALDTLLWQALENWAARRADYESNHDTTLPDGDLQILSPAQISCLCRESLW